MRAVHLSVRTPLWSVAPHGRIIVRATAWQRSVSRGRRRENQQQRLERANAGRVPFIPSSVNSTSYNILGAVSEVLRKADRPSQVCTIRSLGSPRTATEAWLWTHHPAWHRHCPLSVFLFICSLCNPSAMLCPPHTCLPRFPLSCAVHTCIWCGVERPHRSCSTLREPSLQPARHLGSASQLVAGMD